MKHTVVIGGNGFIGSGLVPLLLKRRHVTIIDRQKAPKEMPGVQYFQVDCKNTQTLATSISNVHEVIYLAWASTPASNADPEYEIKENVLPLNKLMKSLVGKRLEKFIFMSSGGAIYGDVGDTPISESQAPQPISTYGKSKLKAEEVGMRLYAQVGFPFVSLRPSNAYGPGQTPYKGQGLISTALASARDGKQMQIFGGGIIRDYIYIDDLCEAIVKALDTVEAGEVYNIGAEKGLENVQVIKAIEKLVMRDTYKLDCVIKQRREFDPGYNILNTSKFTNISGWQPKVHFEEGLKQTWEWIQHAK